MIQPDADRLGAGPATLIRTTEGHITYWSPAMELRYGFAADAAVGHVSHQLLRTTSWQAHSEIDATLLERGTWRGSLIHRRADNWPVIAANYWCLHRGDAEQAALITEVHSDLVPTNSAASEGIADVLAALAQELGQPLAAISGYVSGALNALDRQPPAQARLAEALTKATDQLLRAGEILTAMRTMGAGLREPRLIQAHRDLTATMQRTHRISEHAHRLIEAALAQRNEMARRKDESRDETE